MTSKHQERGTKELRGRTLSLGEHSLRDAGGGHAARRRREARLLHDASALALTLALARRRRRCEELLAHAVEALERPLLPDVRLEERGAAVEEGGERGGIELWLWMRWRIAGVCFGGVGVGHVMKYGT